VRDDSSTGEPAYAMLSVQGSALLLQRTSGIFSYSLKMPVATKPLNLLSVE